MQKTTAWGTMPAESSELEFCSPPPRSSKPKSESESDASASVSLSSRSTRTASKMQVMNSC